MTNAEDLRSGKGHRDENFPVASWLIQARHRAPILAFYEFVRTADDIADHAQLTAQKKVEMLDEMEADLLGSGNGSRGCGRRFAKCSPSEGCRRATPRTCSRRSGSTPPSCATRTGTT